MFKIMMKMGLKGLTVLVCLCNMVSGQQEPRTATVSRTATVDLSSTATSNIAANMVYIVPVLIFIIILDFAIFGTYANRSDKLNPISDFFYHVRRGATIVRNKAGSRPHGAQRLST